MAQHARSGSSSLYVHLHKEHDNYVSNTCFVLLCCVLLGSHKAEWMLPGDRFTSMDLPMIQHVPTNAGDVLLFLGASLTHGAYAWEGQAQRRAAIFFFHSAFVALPQATPGAALPRL